MTPLLPPHLRGPLLDYLALLERWNRIHSLTALPPEARWEELVLDSAALLPGLADLPEGARLGDFGTGMGMPAVLIALARPDLEVLAIDKSKKKLAFVLQAGLQLGLRNLKTVHGRFEALPPMHLAAGVAKALAPLELLAGWWLRHGQPGAPFLALKGSGTEVEATLPGWDITRCEYQLPTRGRRVVLNMKKGG